MLFEIGTEEKVWDGEEEEGVLGGEHNKTTQKRTKKKEESLQLPYFK